MSEAREVQGSRCSAINRTARWGVVAAAAVGVWLARGRLADWVTDSLFRRPGGDVARRFYRDAQPHQEAFRETLAALSLGPEDRVLEVGCGGGTFLEWALATGCTARAIDHSAEMLKLASHRNAPAIAAGRLELHDADAGALPFSDGEFTAAATMNAFFFFDEPQAMLAEVYRTLAPAGRIAIHTAATAPPVVARRMHLYRDDELVRMLEHAGYEHIAVRRTGRGAQMQLATAQKPASSAADGASEHGEDGGALGPTDPERRVAAERVDCLSPRSPCGAPVPAFVLLWLCAHTMRPICGSALG